MPYGRGFGFRGSSPGLPYVGLGRGGLPRCWAYAPSPYGAAFGQGSLASVPWYGLAMPPQFGPPMTLEDEKHMLQQQANTLKAAIAELSKRIEALEQKSQEESR